jgi:hypothetical protein
LEKESPEEQAKRKLKANELSKAWKKANPEKARVASNRANKQRQQNGKALAWRRKRDYGISPLDYEQLFLVQKGLCGAGGHIITERQKKKTDKFCVDHHHESGEVRGLLCDPCNRAAGLFDEDVDRLRSAIRYLEEAQQASSKK